MRSDSSTLTRVELGEVRGLSEHTSAYVGALEHVPRLEEVIVCGRGVDDDVGACVARSLLSRMERSEENGLRVLEMTSDGLTSQSGRRSPSVLCA